MLHSNKKQGVQRSAHKRTHQKEKKAKDRKEKDSYFTSCLFFIRRKAKPKEGQESSLRELRKKKRILAALCHFSGRQENLHTTE